MPPAPPSTPPDPNPQAAKDERGPPACRDMEALLARLEKLYPRRSHNGRGGGSGAESGFGIGGGAGAGGSHRAVAAAGMDGGSSDDDAVEVVIVVDHADRLMDDDYHSARWVFIIFSGGRKEAGGADTLPG